MNFDVRLSPNALRDRNRILAWYDDPARHEADRFLDAFFAAARRLGERPLLGRALRDDVRTWHLPVFPYQFWYRVNDSLALVRIIAVVGDRQDAGQFDERLR